MTVVAVWVSELTAWRISLDGHPYCDQLGLGRATQAQAQAWAETLIASHLGMARDYRKAIREGKAWPAPFPRWQMRLLARELEWEI